jgi:hypothetical protein
MPFKMANGGSSSSIFLFSYARDQFRDFSRVNVPAEALPRAMLLESRLWSVKAAAANGRSFAVARPLAALDLQDMLIRPVQRYIKRQLEREIFNPVLKQGGFDPLKV